MLRIFTLALLLAIPTLAMAVEPKFNADVDAKIKAGGETTEMRAKLTGEMGKPLSIQINDETDTKIEATFTPVPAAPTQYKAEIRISRNGKVVSQPMLTSIYGRSCEVQVGAGEDEIRLALTLSPRKR
ncbi:hypothetical protein [Anatilimnocola floriformis]|uniref:hypothetical protein n=1 Tax=Anatilimnocola floriformis TaxID=2948575 RepID=UPI0020C271E5|nr:hypothetical protein [Anatilimnocola floriformis]